MKKIIIASHGKFSKGIEDSIKILIGERKNIDFIAAYREEIPDNRVLNEVFERILFENKDNEVIMFTDITGGSITNTALSFVPKYPNLHIVSGSSLGLILEYILTSEEEEEENEKPDYRKIINQSIEEAKNGMVYINEMLNGGNEDDQIL